MIYALAAVFLVFASPAFAKPPQQDHVWIILRPLQCMSNPWEKEWLEKHNNQVTKYPRAQEYALMKQYFKRHQVTIKSLRVKPYVNGDPRCMTCECPRGDTWFLLVDAPDVPQMVDLGYTERIPVRDVPELKTQK